MVDCLCNVWWLNVFQNLSIESRIYDIRNFRIIKLNSKAVKPISPDSLWRIFSPGIFRIPDCPIGTSEPFGTNRNTHFPFSVVVITGGRS
ncbi:hypothetical protein CEXT_325721 [Caerostris extrusa]|uniref:Uncharacterized protein n=1 Tax=Caerostris extrusa TaxID=172846 RepID=A0AAV4MBU8_CAEEX|nr:hypothetical protein CEXT_325721 [Caerostris extrusa]